MRLSSQQLQTLIEHAIHCAPHEACGLLAGDADEVQLMIPITNIAADPKHYFELDHAAFVRAMFQIQRQGLRLVGIYHSHPAGDPIPSAADIAHAHYPDVEYLIIGMGKSRPRVATWQISRQGVVNAELIVGGQPSKPDSKKLSTAGSVAIFVSAVFATILALAISLSLLPPAPVIP